MRDNKGLLIYKINLQSNFNDRFRKLKIVKGLRVLSCHRKSDETKANILVFCCQKCSDLLLEKNVLVIEKNF